MQVPTALLTTAGLVLAAGLARADDAADKLAERKKQAEADWETVGAGAFSHVETDHLLIYAPKEWEKKLKDVGATLEKHFDTAKAALAFDAKTDPAPTKVLVFLFTEREHFGSFVRKVEKQRLEPAEAACFSAEDETLRVAAGPPRPKQDLDQEGQAGEQLASLLLSRKAGLKTPLPSWLTQGFGRATYHRAVGGPKTAADRGKAVEFAKGKGAREIWTGSVDLERAPALQGSLADYLAYGPGAAKFPAFVKGFQPEENVERKTTEQAFEAAGLMADKVDKGWRGWAPVATR
jgi:hypothetical protein